MKTLHRDLFIALLFITGVYGFLAGEFVMSSVLFASAAIASNVLWAGQKKSA